MNIADLDTDSLVYKMVLFFRFSIVVEKVACAFSLHAFITILLAACSLIQAKVVQNFCLKSHN